MPTTLVLRFPWGRYHATPWGRHVNEGAVELPPSPWRLLRALYAVWRTRVPELDEQTVHTLLTRLAAPPTFHIPRHSVSHTRHYLPDMVHRSGAASVDRTLDAFAVFEHDAELGICWPFELTPSQRAALERLAGSLPYFGRADSLCSGFLATGWEAEQHDTWVPVDVAEAVAEDAPVTSVLAPDLPLRLDALLARPVDVRKGGLLFPAGTYLLAYQRTRPASPLRPQPRRRHSELATAVRFSVLQPGLPPQTDSLIYTDLLRQAALSKLGRLPEDRPRTQLGGRSADDQPMAGHRHAHYLPLISDRRLTGLVVWVPSGLPDELTALTSVKQLYSKLNPDWRLTVRVAGIGTPAQVAPELAAPCPATVWRSVTPFTPSRYPQRNTGCLNYFRTEIATELTNHRLPALRAVRALDEEWQSWRRYRPSARMRHDTRQGQATRPSAFLRIELAEPTHGPLALGHLSHFGLGLFVPDPGR